MARLMTGSMALTTRSAVGDSWLLGSATLLSCAAADTPRGAGSPTPSFEDADVLREEAAASSRSGREKELRDEGLEQDAEDVALCQVLPWGVDASQVLAADEADAAATAATWAPRGPSSGGNTDLRGNCAGIMAKPELPLPPTS